MINAIIESLAAILPYVVGLGFAVMFAILVLVVLAVNNGDDF